MNLCSDKVSFAFCCVLFSRIKSYFSRKLVTNSIFVWWSCVFSVISVIECHRPSWSSVRISSILSVKG